MPTHQWARHSDAIEDARNEGDVALLKRAVQWAVVGNLPETDDLYQSLCDEFQAQGNSNASSCETNRALEIILDAFLEEQKARRAA